MSHCFIDGRGSLGVLRGHRNREIEELRYKARYVVVLIPVVLREGHDSEGVVHRAHQLRRLYLAGHEHRARYSEDVDITASLGVEVGVARLERESFLAVEHRR